MVGAAEVLGGTVADEGLAAQISALIVDPDRLDDAPYEVVVECARRYLIGQQLRRQRRSVRQSEQYRSTVTQIEQRTVAAVRLITTRMYDEVEGAVLSKYASFLSLNFSLPDGSSVRWSEATAVQHEARAEFLEMLAAGNADTARLHRSAIRDITAGGVDTLGGLS
mgnify:CR=1 FL=1